MIDGLIEQSSYRTNKKCILQALLYSVCIGADLERVHAISSNKSVCIDLHTKKIKKISLNNYYNDSDQKNYGFLQRKSRIRETKHLSTDADSSTDTKKSC